MESDKLSLRGLTLLTVGAMVGSAIFSLSGVTIAAAGSLSLVSWLIAAALLLFYGLLTSYLARHFPRSSGMFHFAADALAVNSTKKRWIGSITSLAYFGGCLAGVIFSAQYIGYYFGAIFPDLDPIWGAAFAIITVGSAAVLNLIKVRKMGAIQNVLTAILVLSILVYVLYIFTSGHFDFSHVVNGGTGVTAQGMFFSIPIAMLAYGSIVVPALMFGSIKNPLRNITRAQIYSMLVTVVLYLLAIFATLGVVNAADLEKAPEQAYTPFSYAVSLSGGNSAISTLINVAAILALLTTQIIVLSLAVSSINVIAKENSLPSGLKAKPGVTIGIAVVVTLFVLFPTLSDQVVYTGGIFNAVFVAIICFSAGLVLWKKGHRMISVLSYLVLIVLLICYLIPV